MVFYHSIKMSKWTALFTLVDNNWDCQCKIQSFFMHMHSVITRHSSSSGSGDRPSRCSSWSGSRGTLQVLDPETDFPRLHLEWRTWG